MYLDAGNFSQCQMEGLALAIWLLVLFWYTFTNTYFGKSKAFFLLVLLTTTIPHVG